MIKIYYPSSYFGGSRTRYLYAAIRSGDGLWYTTGPKSPKGFTWDQLLAWLTKEGHTVKKFRVR